MQVSGYNPYIAVTQPQSTLPNRSVTPVGQTTSTTVADYYQDRFAPSTQLVQYGQGQNVIHGQAKNMGLRFVERELNIQSNYIEADLIDKTPQNPIDIENLDFNLYVKSGEIHVSDVSATMTVRAIFDRQLKRTGKAVPIEDFRISFDPHNQIRVEGKYKALGGLFKLPFEVKGNVSVRSTGEVQYALGDAKVSGVKVNGIMNTFGLTLDKLLKMNDRSQGYYTEGNSVVVDVPTAVTQLDEIGLHGQVRGARTHLGNLSLLIGDTAEDATRAWEKGQEQGPAYLKGTQGHAYIDGFFIKDSTVHIYDQTPGSPLNLNAPGPYERAIQLKSGLVGITEPRFEELIKDEIGEGGDFSDVSTSLEDNTSKLNGKMWGFVPINLDLKFSNTPDGKLLLTADNPKAFGFVPLPKGFVQKKVQGIIKTGVPYGNGVALDGMTGMDLGHVSRVIHQKDYIVLESGQKDSKYDPYFDGQIYR